MCDPVGPALSARLNAQAIPNALKAALGQDPYHRLMSGPSVDSGGMRANWKWSGIILARGTFQLTDGPLVVGHVLLGLVGITAEKENRR
jgi:hypothetical protein